MSAPADPSEISNRTRAVRTALLSVCLGPVIGWTLLYAALGIVSVFTSDDGLTGLRVDAALSIWAIGALYSYIVAGIPALVSAVLVGRHVFLRGTIGFVSCAVIAALVTAAFLLVLGLRTAVGGTSQWGDWLRLAAAGGALSAASALVCRWIAGRMGVLPSSATSSPSPAPANS